jgi:hypothetical protein
MRESSAIRSDRRCSHRRGSHSADSVDQKWTRAIIAARSTRRWRRQTIAHRAPGSADRLCRNLTTASRFRSVKKSGASLVMVGEIDEASLVISREFPLVFRRCMAGPDSSSQNLDRSLLR